LVASLKGSVPATADTLNNLNPDVGLVKNLGRVLFTEFLLPFEISSILFLSAMVGAIMLGKKQVQ
jgi:NADH-quinone oxidoreductase subunit J